MQTRYKKSVEPVETDGRDIDLTIGQLIGEGANQLASGSSDQHIKSIAKTWKQLPEPASADPTYYDRPLLNEPVWEWAIPAYYFVGGLTGAALALGAAAQALSRNNTERLIRRCDWIGFLGAAVSSLLLTYDLGRPSRFLNMLRVFRPTSPMNVGAWILSSLGGTAAATIVFRGCNGVFGAIGEASGFASGVLGLGLATYTGVLVSNTAVPVWQESRRVLPILFGSSAMATVGSVFKMFVETSEERRVTKAFGTIGQLVELTASMVMEKQASVVPRVGLPLRRGLSGTMWKGAALLTSASVVVGALPKRSRNKRITAGVLGMLGSLLLRFAVHHAGVVSSRDARASFHQQRAGV